ncbi:MAG: LysR family transcriptional regulator [Bdellovibrionota bacterium]
MGSSKLFPMASKQADFRRRPRLNFNLNLLDSLVALSLEKSVVAAAKSLGLSQPALSVQLRKLEESLGAKLFNRQGRCLELTEPGLIAKGYAIEILALCEELASAVRNVGQESQEQLRIGLSDQLAASFLGSLVSVLGDGEADGRRLVLYDVAEDLIASRLRQGLIDVGVVSKMPGEPHVRVLAQLEMPVRLVVPTSVPTTLMRRLNQQMTSGDHAGMAGSVRAGDLKFVLPSKKYQLRKETDAFFKLLNLHPKVTMETDFLGYLMMAAFSQKGIAFLPLPFVPDFMLGKQISIEGPASGLWIHEAWIVCQANFQNELVETRCRAFARSLQGGGLATL